MFEGGMNGVLELLIEKTYELTGFKLEWTNKPFENILDIQKWIDEVINDEKPNDDLIADMTEIGSAINNCDCGVIETIMKILPDNFIYSVEKDDGSKGEWYGWNGSDGRKVMLHYARQLCMK